MMVRDKCLGFLYLPSFFERCFMLVVESRMSMMRSMRGVEKKETLAYIPSSTLLVRAVGLVMTTLLEIRGCYTAHSRANNLIILSIIRY